MARFGKPFYIALGWLCVGLGVLGIIMPVLPTTPFLLLAVWAFSRSSPELAEKIRQHPRLGPPIRAWQDHGVIPPYAKVLAILMMAGSLSFFWLLAALPMLVLIVISAVFAAVGAYIVTRPNRPHGRPAESPGVRTDG